MNIHESEVDPRRSGGQPGSESGAALFIMVVAVVVAAGLAFALGTVAMSRQKVTENRIGMEAALQVAEAGLSRGLAEGNLPANRADPNWPPPPSPLPSPADYLKPPFNDAFASTFRIDGSKDPFDNVYASDFDASSKTRSLMGEFRLQFFRGDLDNVDNDNDGLKDAADPDEKDYITVVSTGYRGAASKTNMYKVRVMGTFLKVKNNFDIQAAVFIDDPTPNVDMGSSKSYTVSGLDHDMYSKGVVAATPPLPALATTGVFNGSDTTDILAKSGPGGQITGTSPTYQNSNPTTMNFASVIQFAKDNADPSHVVVGPGVNPPGPFGIPPGATPASPGTFEITYSAVGGPGNAVKYTSNTSGAGIWVVDGDLEIGGTFNYTGIIVVTGAVRFVGGGSSKMVLGAVVTGQTASVDNLSTTGTIDLWYSNSAVTSAVNALARFVPVGYQKLPSQQ